MNPNLLRSVLFAVWAVDETAAVSALPLLGKMIRGENFRFYEATADSFKPYAVTVASKHWRYGFADAKPNSVSILKLKGMITKEDQECGPRGTLSFMNDLSEADANPNILAHVIDIDSGGGEATNIASVANFIRNQVKKPVFAWYNGLNASAAYGIAAGADEIFAAQETDIVGSIGVMTTIANWKEYYKSQGLQIEDVYSNLSSEKNGVWQEALNGNFEPLKTQLLDPFAKTFHESVKSMRPNLDEKVLKGATYMTSEAKKLGLIDGQKNWQEMLEYAESKGLAYRATVNKIGKNKNSTDMKFEKIAAFFGFQSVEQDADGNVSFTAEQAEKIEQHLAATDGLEAKITAAVDAKLTAMETTLNEKINEFELQQKTIQETVDAVADLAPKQQKAAGEEKKGEDNEQFMSKQELELQAEFDKKKKK